MKTNQLIGLTIGEALPKIKQAERNADLYQVYICTLEHKERNYFELDKKVHYHNEKGERVYRIVNYDLLTYAKDKELQKDSFILDCHILQEYHDNWSLNGFVNTTKHNIYYLYVDGIKKGNKAREVVQNRKEELKPYKKGDLTKAQRRFTL